MNRNPMPMAVLLLAVLLSLSACGGGRAHLPVASPGDNASVASGSAVVLDGSASFDPEGNPLTFLWRIVQSPAGSGAALDNAASPTPSFTADRDGDYVLSLVVTSHRSSGITIDSAPSLVRVTALNSAPVAAAGADRSVLAHDNVVLDGSVSHDNNADPVSYRWSFASVPAGSALVALTDNTSAHPSFVPDVPGPFVVRLVANDGKTDGAPDDVTVTSVRCPVGTAWEGGACSASRTLAYFPLDGNVADNAGVYTGTLGTGSWTAGIDNQALRGPLSCNNPPAARVDGFPEVDNSFTVEAFVRPSCSSSQGNLTVAKWARGYEGPGFILFSEPVPYGSGNYHFYLRVNSGTVDISARPPTAVTYACGVWHHVAGVREKGTTLRIYVDGVEAGIAADTAGSIANGKPLTFSGCTEGGCGWAMSPVDIDDVAVYDRALTPPEIRGHSEQYP